MWLSPAIQHTHGPLGARRGRTAVVAGGTSAYAERGKTFEGQSPLRGSTILRISGAVDNRRSKAQGMLMIARAHHQRQPGWAPPLHAVRHDQGVVEWSLVLTRTAKAHILRLPTRRGHGGSGFSPV